MKFYSTSLLMLGQTKDATIFHIDH